MCITMCLIQYITILVVHIYYLQFISNGLADFGRILVLGMTLSDALII